MESFTCWLESQLVLKTSVRKRTEGSIPSLSFITESSSAWLEYAVWGGGVGGSNPLFRIKQNVNKAVTLLGEISSR